MCHLECYDSSEVLRIMEKFHIYLLAVQETECLRQDKEQWLRKGENNFLFVHTGVRKGVGFILSQEILPIETKNFQEISPRILRLNLSQEFFYSGLLST